MTLPILVLSLVLAAMASALSIASVTERQVAAAHARHVAAGYVAEAAIERALPTLTAWPDWSSAPGTWVAGSPVTTAAVEARTGAHNRVLASMFPLGPDTPRWRVVATDLDGVWAAVVWVADDPGDGDDDPTQDRNGRLMLRAEVWSGATRRRVDLYVVREGEALRRLAWREGA